MVAVWILIQLSTILQRNNLFDNKILIHLLAMMILRMRITTSPVGEIILSKFSLSPGTSPSSTVVR